MANSHRRSLIVNTISKYWWVGRTLYDENSENPWKLLEYFKSDYSTRTLILLSSSYANNHKIIKKTIESLINLERKIGRNLTRREYRDSLSYINILGGINVLDYFDKEELKIKIKDNFYKNII